MISIIVPVYNGEKYIERCVDSILLQTYSDFEIIVINDGSVDNTNELLLKISDPRVRVISQNNSGVSSARNRGISESKGEFIVFIDGDDYVEPTFLNTLISSYQEGIMPVVGFSKNSSNENVLRDEIHCDYNIGPYMPRDYLIGNLGKTVSFSCCNKLFFKKLIIENDLKFPEDLKLGEDLIFVFRYLCHCKGVKYIDSVEYHYCDNNDSAVHSYKDRSKDYEHTLQILGSVSENNYRLNEYELCVWCLDVSTYILGNPYVINLNYRKFKKYFYEIKKLQVIKYAMNSSEKRGVKRKAFLLFLKCKNPFFMFISERLNFHYNRSRY